MEADKAIADTEKHAAVRDRGEAELARDAAVRDRGEAELMRDIAVRERDEAVGQSTVRGAVPTGVEMESSRAALIQVVETAVVGRTAEALRRRATEELLIGVATCEQAFRSVTQQNRAVCRCFERSTAAVTPASTLPTASDNRALASTVVEVLRSLSMGQPLSLDSYRIAEYWFDEGDDRNLVDGARRVGRGNAATYRILEGSLAIDPHATAVTHVNRNWPLQIPGVVVVTDAAAAQSSPRQQFVPTPPIGQEEVVETTEDDARS
eukprot:GHVU01201122.1.p1 GENE.GHVU01201122.1~~GHVU01201122.1.p1  ORF type:complete len:294 (+),score=39.20 GHVU01201122.1:88-882(+)